MANSNLQRKPTPPKWCGFCLFQVPDIAITFGTPEPRVVYRTTRAATQHQGTANTSLSEEGRFDPQSLPSFYNLISVSDFLASISRGCVGCRALWQAFCGKLHPRKWQRHDNDEIIVVLWTLASYAGQHDQLPFIGREFTLKVPIGLDHDHKQGVFLMRAVLACESVDATTHPCAVATPPAPVERRSTGSVESLLMLQNWLENCDKHHYKCINEVNALPDRVLELSRSHSGYGEILVRLVEIKGKDKSIYAPYMCLSHRWGSSTQQHRTTKSNIEKYKDNIPWEWFPRTFQEAAAVTLFLGMRYIWIDSLCIIQDDIDDWREQSTKMCSIYAGARLTIAAVCSLDSQQGLFSTPNITHFDIEDGQTHRYSIRYKFGHREWNGHINRLHHFPLLDRGWVYQERLLSPRVAYFTTHEVRFECFESDECECGYDQVTDNRKLTHRQNLLNQDTEDVRQYWESLVVEYAHLSLTNATDRLPALAGIAEQFGVAHGAHLGRYIVGMWEECLCSQLAWEPEETTKNLDGRHSRPTAYCGPSWSWVSVSGAPIFPETSTLEVSEDKLFITECHIELAGTSPYGAVTHAELTIDALLAEGTLEDMTQLKHSNYEFFDQESNTVLSFWSDYDLRCLDRGFVAFGSRLYAVKTGCSRISPGPTAMFYILILRAVHHHGRTNHGTTKYERIAIAQAPKATVDKLFKDRPRKTITLV
ncbi:heterokaryon incompatibility protein-domain-containing protein [Plectosphaerella plurivora]|uniref:Heterokaryon incompatibility protein-domain-containing protein n=1 Tax=Plectosphaerella plurivora TaxID=936078 RepID=A0A9P9A4W9_9PEZI|nr:heterokaryon incompatibility protein-domain-containing protein [Plectosphaerella plurivora]